MLTYAAGTTCGLLMVVLEHLGGTNSRVWGFELRVSGIRVQPMLWVLSYAAGTTCGLLMVVLEHLGGTNSRVLGFEERGGYRASGFSSSFGFAIYGWIRDIEFFMSQNVSHCLSTTANEHPKPCRACRSIPSLPPNPHNPTLLFSPPCTRRPSLQKPPPLTFDLAYPQTPDSPLSLHTPKPLTHL